MTGLHARRGWSVRWVRTGIELTVLTAGWLLGGTVGVGTVLYAVAIGPLTQLFLPWVVYREPAGETLWPAGCRIGHRGSDLTMEPRSDPAAAAKGGVGP